jgi:hypothetical protein
VVWWSWQWRSQPIVLTTASWLISVRQPRSTASHGISPQGVNWRLEYVTLPTLTYKRRFQMQSIFPFTTNEEFCCRWHEVQSICLYFCSEKCTSTAVYWLLNGNSSAVYWVLNGNSSAVYWLLNGNSSAVYCVLNGNSSAVYWLLNGNSSAVYWVLNGNSSAVYRPPIPETV